MGVEEIYPSAVHVYHGMTDGSAFLFARIKLRCGEFLYRVVRKYQRAVLAAAVVYRAGESVIFHSRSRGEKSGLIRAVYAGSAEIDLLDTAYVEAGVFYHVAYEREVARCQCAVLYVV